MIYLVSYKARSNLGHKHIEMDKWENGLDTEKAMRIIAKVVGLNHDDVCITSVFKLQSEELLTAEPLTAELCSTNEPLYTVGIHGTDNSYEEIEEFKPSAQIAKGDKLCLSIGDKEYDVFEVVHTPGKTYVHVK